MISRSGPLRFDTDFAVFVATPALQIAALVHGTGG